MNDAGINKGVLSLVLTGEVKTDIDVKEVLRISFGLKQSFSFDKKTIVTKSGEVFGSKFNQLVRFFERSSEIGLTVGFTEKPSKRIIGT